MAQLNVESKPYGTTFYTYTGDVMIAVDGNLDVDKTVAELFKSFNEEIKKTISEKEKITSIAKLYQTLERIHPPADGTTRTDLIIMNVLLCKHGLNPAILYDPAFALFHTLERWIPYLEKGIKDWKLERDAKQNK